MGILTTVIKKSDGTTQSATPSIVSAHEEKKMLVNINSGIEELKTQNLENTKFLRGMSRKVEEEFAHMKELQENSAKVEVKAAVAEKPVVTFDASAVLESIENVQNSITKDISDIQNSITKDISDIQNSIARDISDVQQSIAREISDVQGMISDGLSGDDGKQNEIAAKQEVILEQLESVRETVANASQLLEELSTKVDRVATMPSMIKSIVEHNNTENEKKIEELITEINDKERSKFDSMKTLISINLWVSLLTVATLIARVLGII